MICTPTPTHADLIERAAASGKAVFCEKPIDLDASRVRACLQTANKAGIPLMIGFNRRFDPSFRTLHDRLRAGEIGRLETLTIISRDPQPPPPSYVASSGGLFRDMMIHDFDMARFLLGEDPTEVYAIGSVLVDKAIGDAGDVDTAAVLLRTASGAIAQITNSRRATYGYDQRIEAHGATGMLRAGNMTATTVEFASAGGFVTDPALPFFLERYGAASAPNSTPSCMRSRPPPPLRQPGAMDLRPSCSQMRRPSQRGRDDRSGRLRPDHQLRFHQGAEPQNRKGARAAQTFGPRKERNAPWPCMLIPSIARTISPCRSPASSAGPPGLTLTTSRPVSCPVSAASDEDSVTG